MVGERGLEPPRLAALGPKPSVYTNFTTHPRRSRGNGFRKYASCKLTPASARLLFFNFANGR